MRVELLICAALVGALFATGGAAAEHLPQQTFRCTYEVGNIDFLQLSHEDDVGVTSDGGINLGGCNHRIEPRHPPIFSASVPINFDPDVLQIGIVDDVFGGDIGAIFCNDIDNTHTCSDDVEGEQLINFCGTSPVIEAQTDSDGDGQKDFGHHLFVLINGPINQAMFCNPVNNPVGGTSGGVLNPAAGVFYTAS